MDCHEAITSNPAGHHVLASTQISQTSLKSEFLTRPTLLYRSGQSIFWEGDDTNSVFLVATGVLRVSRCLVDGRRGVIGFIFPEEMLGLATRSKHTYSAEAVTDCYIRALPRQKVNALLADSSSMREEFISELCGEISQMQAQLLILSQRCAEERVASLILQIAAKSSQRVGGKVQVQLPMSRLDVADYLGLTVETVCRAFGKLKKANYIKLFGRGVVTIERLTDLEDFACADTGAYNVS